MTTSQDPQDKAEQTALEQDIISQVQETWEADQEEDGPEQSWSFAEQLKGWFDNQRDELHDSRGDTEYQDDIIAGLVAFKHMIAELQSFDFGTEDLMEEIRIEGLPQDEYLAYLNSHERKTGNA